MFWVNLYDTGTMSLENTKEIEISRERRSNLGHAMKYMQ